MTSGMPELGSKISLISKADIRYEGRLFTVDPQECTIALASVRSYGTEDRETQFLVPAQNQVYDYILFRGSDIKDIRVVNNVPPHAQPLNDPAIMQLSVPPSLGGQQFQNHPVLGQMGPQMSQFGAGGQYGAGLGGMGGGSAPGMHMPRQGNSKPSELIIPGSEQQPPVLSPTVEPPRANEHGSVLDLIGGGSRSTTPASFSSRKSPTNDQSTQAGHSKDKKMVKPIQPPGQRNNQRQKSRERKDSRGDGQQPQQHHQHQNRQHMNRQHQQQQHGNYHHQGYNNQHQQQQQQQGGHGPQQRGGGWTNRGPLRMRGRPRGGGFKPNQGQPNPANNKGKNTLKFDNDYDFEQANTEFEELRTQFAKVKIDEAGSTSTKSEVNGDVDKKDDSGNETGAGETEQEEDHDTYYDKSKSFFDKISCEAVERAKGKSQRTDWRTERKLNSETFGVSATRRGNYRGRGGFRGMGRGGYRGGYRQPQRRDQQPQNQQQQQQPGNQRAEQTSEKAQGAQNTNSSTTAADKVVDPPTVVAGEPELVKETAEETPVVATNSEMQVSVPEPAMAVI